MTISNTDRRTAAMYHRCECGSTIRPGERYTRIFAISTDSFCDGPPVNQKLASCCDPGLVERSSE